MTNKQLTRLQHNRTGEQMKQIIYGVFLCFSMMVNLVHADETISVSEATQACIDCHFSYHPGIVEDWKKSRHYQTTPETAMTVTGPGKKISASQIPESLQKTSVGCAECHTQNPQAHTDSFEHNGFDVHAVVTPNDCATCHAVERSQYDRNIMAHAWQNLAGNPIYQDLQRTIIGRPEIKNGAVHFGPSDPVTEAETCFYCHGTKLVVKGLETRDTDAGELEFPIIDGWPNQGVGRINPDGSKGACSACHTRHLFSMETARKPATCKECHNGPDVPAYKVYDNSKHGNLASAHSGKWNFDKTPWTVGEDFSAPTCATCHISLLPNTDGKVVAERTHQMSDRLSWRIFGLPYAHPQPKEPDTSIIRNKNNQSLPCDLDGGFASQYQIDQPERAKRTAVMQGICKNCHDTSWVNSHWARYEHTIQTTNAATRTATDLMRGIWKKGLASGPEKKASLFDEPIERMWSSIWLFDANNIRFTSAMAGGGDYGVFAEGYYNLSRRLTEMNAWMKK
jgi:hypothetical protein